MVWMPAVDLAPHELRLNYSDVWELGLRLARFLFIIIFYLNKTLRFNTITNAVWTPMTPVKVACCEYE